MTDLTAGALGDEHFGCTFLVLSAHSHPGCHGKYIGRIAGYPTFDFDGDIVFAAGEVSVMEQTRKVRLAIPVEFFAEVEVDRATGDPTIRRFIVSPLESYAGNFMTATVADWGDVDDTALSADELAALNYWRECNDGTWPLDRIDWEE